ncbi:hypothetical protein EBI_26809 [Enterocytozoon bieneusi H348]|nr:hypothetical protein EBI_26809 [Enterocytozoon bieneusi H348]|eukprot:XP_002651197.1 hypothetical protein EBI_26809 [Enterocytozoon bieneusi H348]
MGTKKEGFFFYKTGESPRKNPFFGRLRRQCISRGFL